MKQKPRTERVEKDAKPQFVRTRKGATNSGVSSAKPQVITGSADASFETDPEDDGER